MAFIVLARFSASARSASGTRSGIKTSLPCGGTSFNMVLALFVASHWQARPSRRLIDNMVDGRLFHFPCARIPVVTRQRKAVPIFVIQSGMIGAIVVPGPARFGAEQRVLRHAFRRQRSVLQFPRTLQLMKILGA